MSFQHEFLSKLLTGINEAISANDAADVDRTARWHLDTLTRQLKRYQRAIAADTKGGPELGLRGAAVRYGPNAHGPAIDDLIRDSEWHRHHGKVEMLEAAE